jgi:hypothetical protein
MAPNARVVELGLHRLEAGLDVSQAVAIGELSEDHRKKLVPAGEGSYSIVASVAVDTLVELVLRDPVEELREHGSSDMHRPILSLAEPRKLGQSLSNG